MSMYGKATRRPVVVCGPGRTVQSHKDACDVNNIMRRYARDGFLAHVSRGVPTFGDWSEVGDFRQAIELVRSGTDFFSKLPAKVRAKFDNDAARFIDEAGKLSREEMRELGLAELRRTDRQRRASDVEEPSPTSAGEGSGTVTS